MHLTGSIHEDFGILQPYAEALLGFQVLWTDTKIEDQEPDNQEDDIASNTHISDWTSSLGVGGGVRIRLTDFDTDTIDQDADISFLHSTLYLDLKVRYIFGGEADYLKEGNIMQGPNNEIILNKSHSETDYMTFHIGLTIYLSDK